MADWAKVHVTSELALWLVTLVVGALLYLAPVVWRRVFPKGAEKQDKQSTPKDGSPNEHGPVYWQAVEALSWIAVGKPIRAEIWKSDTLERELTEWPKDLQERFDSAEHQFFEKIRDEKLEIKGAKTSGDTHETIPAEYFLGRVAIHILSNSTDVDGKRIEDILVFNLPKYRDLQVKRSEVLKLWPEGGKDFEWPREKSREKPSGKTERDVWLFDAIYRVALGKWDTFEIDPNGSGLSKAEIDALCKAVWEEIPQRAFDGELPIWGKQGQGALWKLIPHDYWEHYRIDWFEFLKGDRELIRTEPVSRSQPGPFIWYSLKTSRKKVEELWPAANTYP